MNPAFHLPSVDKLLQHPRTAALRERFGTTQCTEAIRAALAHARAQWLADKDKAHAELSEARRIFAQLGALPDLQRSEQALIAWKNTGTPA